MKFDYQKGRILFKFLKRHGVLYKYIRNVCCDESITEEKMKNKDFLLRYLDIYGIEAGFVWRDTPEGEEYWNNLDKEYDRVLFNKYIDEFC